MRGYVPKPTAAKPHQCIICDWLVMEDMWCEAYQRTITDPYEPLKCRRFKEAKA